jgi:hypothetical protein
MTDFADRERRLPSLFSQNVFPKGPKIFALNAISTCQGCQSGLESVVHENLEDRCDRSAGTYGSFAADNVAPTKAELEEMYNARTARSTRANFRRR